MGVITKEVETTIAATTVDYYKEKGYYIPTYIASDGKKKIKKGTKIIVDIKDLPNQSNVKVLVECDGLSCDKIMNVPWARYTSCTEKYNGNYYCKSCASNLFGKYKAVKTKLKNSISFAQWGIDNIDIDFLEKYWDYSKNDISPWKVSYRSTKKVWIKCQDVDYHESFEIPCCVYNSENVKSGCPYCVGFKTHPLDSLGKTLDGKNLLCLWSNKNNKSPFTFPPHSQEEVWWKCKDDIHKDYKRSVKSSNRYDFRCPECSRERGESILQEKVRLYINEFEYTISHENNCSIIPINPKTNFPMPFDNEILELKLIIEVHGRQHYFEESGIWFDENYDLQKRKLYDKYKKDYALSQGYFYLEIPYWTDDEEETWKKLIDDKIKEIKYKKEVV